MCNEKNSVGRFLDCVHCLKELPVAGAEAAEGQCTQEPEVAVLFESPTSEDHENRKEVMCGQGEVPQEASGMGHGSKLKELPAAIVAPAVAATCGEAVVLDQCASQAAPELVKHTKHKPGEVVGCRCSQGSKCRSRQRMANGSEGFFLVGKEV